MYLMNLNLVIMIILKKQFYSKRDGMIIELIKQEKI